MVKYSLYIENIPNMDYNLLLNEIYINIQTKCTNFPKNKRCKLIMAKKIGCVIGKKSLTEEEAKRAKNEVKKAKDFLSSVFEYMIENNCTHFIIGVTTEADILAAEIIASLKDKNPDVILELAVQNEAMICFAPNEIKSLFLKNKIDLVHIEQKDHEPLEEKECYECMIDRSDFVIGVFNGNINSDVDKKWSYANARKKCKRVITIIT